MKRAQSDPIADCLTRIRNGLAAGHDSVSMPYSSQLELLIGIFKQRGFVLKYATSKSSPPKIDIKLQDSGIDSPIVGLERVSKPGRRVYVKATGIPKIMGGKGMAVISTSKGLLDDTTARSYGLGGEFICKVW